MPIPDIALYTLLSYITRKALPGRFDPEVVEGTAPALGCDQVGAAERTVYFV